MKILGIELCEKNKWILKKKIYNVNRIKSQTLKISRLAN